VHQALSIANIGTVCDPFFLSYMITEWNCITCLLCMYVLYILYPADCMYTASAVLYCMYCAAQVPGKNTVESLALGRYFLIAALDRWENVPYVRSGFTYNPDDVNIFRYGARRSSVNKI
jgi:hypothetical protein